MNVFYWLGIVFLVLFLVTLAWEILSRFSGERVPQAEAVIVKPKDEWDPFKHLAETGKSSGNSDVKVVVPPRSEAGPISSIEALSRSAAEASASAGPAAGKPSQPEEQKAKAAQNVQEQSPPQEEKSGAQSAPSIELEDPWKALMQESAKTPPSKPREIPLELDSSSKDEAQDPRKGDKK